MGEADERMWMVADTIRWQGAVMGSRDRRDRVSRVGKGVPPAFAIAGTFVGTFKTTKTQNNDKNKSCEIRES